MNKFVAICFALLSVKTFCRGSCPLDSVTPSQNVTQMVGRWLEYKKTTDFLTNNLCTTYDVMCPEDGACNVNLLPNGTNTGYANTLIKTGTSTMWDNNTIYLNVNLEEQFAMLWNCNDEEQKKYEIVVLMRDISNEDTMKKIDKLMETFTVSYLSEVEVTNNTLCNDANKSTIHFTALIILVFRIYIVMI